MSSEALGTEDDNQELLKSLGLSPTQPVIVGEEDLPDDEDPEPAGIHQNGSLADLMFGGGEEGSPDTKLTASGKKTPRKRETPRSRVVTEYDKYFKPVKPQDEAIGRPEMGGVRWVWNRIDWAKMVEALPTKSALEQELMKMSAQNPAEWSQILFDYIFDADLEDRHEHVVIALLDLGADPLLGEDGFSGKTVFDWFIQRSEENEKGGLSKLDTKIFKELFGRTRHISKEDQLDGTVWLHRAARSSKFPLNLLELVFESDLQFGLNHPDDIRGRTPIFHAVTMQNVPVVKLMLKLKHKLNLHHIDKDGNTVMHIAYERANQDNIDALKKVDPSLLEVVNKRKQTPEDYVASCRTRAMSVLAMEEEETEKFYRFGYVTPRSTTEKAMEKARLYAQLEQDDGGTETAEIPNSPEAGRPPAAVGSPVQQRPNDAMTVSPAGGRAPNQVESSPQSKNGTASAPKKAQVPASPTTPVSS